MAARLQCALKSVEKQLNKAGEYSDEYKWKKYEGSNSFSELCDWESKQILTLFDNTICGENGIKPEVPFHVPRKPEADAKKETYYRLMRDPDSWRHGIQNVYEEWCKDPRRSFKELEAQKKDKQPANSMDKKIRHADFTSYEECLYLVKSCTTKDEHWRSVIELRVLPPQSINHSASVAEPTAKRAKLSVDP